MTITIYHNQNCGTSRTVLARLRELGHEPLVIEYLKTPPSREEMKKLLAGLGMTPRQILRRKGTPYDDLNLDDAGKSDEEILDALGAHPILMERPVVVTPKGSRVCRRPRSWTKSCPPDSRLGKQRTRKDRKRSCLVEYWRCCRQRHSR